MVTQLIRPACKEDAAELARLAGQLGYPVAVDSMRGRLQRLLGSPADIVLVAESSKDGLAGWIHGFVSQLLESELRVEIGGLIVDEQFQRQGIGSQLVRQLEAWAVGQGIRQVSVRCRTTRPEAHLFYERLGFLKAKTQAVFRKGIGEGEGRVQSLKSKSSSKVDPEGRALASPKLAEARNENKDEE